MALKMHNQHPHRISLIIVIGIMCSVLGFTNEDYLIGVAESSQGPRFAFVNLDAGMASQLVTIKVLERLKSR